MHLKMQHRVCVFIHAGRGPRKRWLTVANNSRDCEWDLRVYLTIRKIGDSWGLLYTCSVFKSTGKWNWIYIHIDAPNVKAFIEPGMIYNNMYAERCITACIQNDIQQHVYSMIYNTMYTEWYTTVCKQNGIQQHAYRKIYNSMYTEWYTTACMENDIQQQVCRIIYNSMFTEHLYWANWLQRNLINDRLNARK